MDCSPRKRHRENLQRGIGQAKKAESRVAQEHAAREAVLDNHILILPGAGRAVKAPFDLRLHETLARFLKEFRARVSRKFSADESRDRHA